jgi:threonine dehydratase
MKIRDSVLFKKLLTNPGGGMYTADAGRRPRAKNKGQWPFPEGHPVKLEKTSSLAGGIAIRWVGRINFDNLQKHVDQGVTVEENEIPQRG